MKIQEEVELFRENTDEKNRTWGQDRPKINRFIDLVGGIQMHRMTGGFYVYIKKQSIFIPKILCPLINILE
ncbi:hypothetical protein [Peribacillus simplex]|uniref:Uncharacterized protein n=1 Tax=Peribacillus simplex TaxID=1478 RepID=A0A9W4KX94_9BACI|nr:hypothetical protein [Peribacillus simplex]MDR4927318.1 hypothetical protein [Peribacillus simplex]WHX92550.1 hypothetical protein QNH50_06760 [Peribacillus simplex]CAH0232298.1 hypothetical protein SRABI133_02669 [Peribacillus simplex]